jgi:3-deoxy-manno-octulosonate cytidylyltransferase (CMP-KDO synthetase)
MELFDRLVVATDSEEVLAHCESIGAPAVMTDPGHHSGTDRIAEVISTPGFRDASVIVNIQADEPLIRESHLASAVRLVRDAGWEVGTCATPLPDPEMRHDPSAVKVVRDSRGGALYFSRAAIPYIRDAAEAILLTSQNPFLRHIGIYVYRRETLLRWVSLPPSPLEKFEKLEQLRALEDGIRIGVAVVDGAAPGVDTPEDVVEVERLLLAEELASR